MLSYYRSVKLVWIELRSILSSKMFYLINIEKIKEKV